MHEAIEYEAEDGISSIRIGRRNVWNTLNEQLLSELLTTHLR